MQKKNHLKLVYQCKSQNIGFYPQFMEQLRFTKSDYKDSKHNGHIPKHEVLLQDGQSGIDSMN